MKGKKLVMRGVIALLVLAVCQVTVAQRTADTPTVEPDEQYRGQLPTEAAAIEKGPPAPMCSSLCDLTAWMVRAPVIDVTGLGGIGVEGAVAGVMRDPNDTKEKLWVSHGFSAGDGAALRIYDIGTDTWSLGPPGAVLRSEGSGAAVRGKLYSIGGRSVIAAVEIFDPGPGTWSPGAPMPTPRSGFGVAVQGSWIHAIGGRTSGAPLGGGQLAVHEVYDTVANSWFALAPLPAPMGDVYATIWFNGRMYVFGGWDGAAARDLTQIYNPTLDSWSLGTAMPTPRSNAAVGVQNKRLIVFGGIDSVGLNTTATEVYDPFMDTWCTGPAKPTAASELSTGGVTSSLGIHAAGSGSFGVNGPAHEVLRASHPSPNENCENGIDDNCDYLVDDDDPRCDPLFVALDYFRARETADGVLIEWATTMEIDNVGFRIKRKVASGNRAKGLTVVTPQVIFGKGDAFHGATYEFLDTNKSRRGAAVHYYLEDIDTSGVVTEHGPVILKLDGSRSSD